MEEILKQDKSKSHKEFEKLLSEDLNNRKLKEGEIITGVVSSIGEETYIYRYRFKQNLKELYQLKNLNLQKK